MAQQYGDIVAFRIRRRPVFFLNRPELIREVLVTRQRDFVKNPGFQNIRRILGDGLLSSEGDIHMRQRRMIQPVFRRDQVGRYGATVSELAARAGDEWRDGVVLDAADEMSRLALSIVGRSLFGADVGDEASEISRALTDAMSLFEGMSSPTSLLLDRLPMVNRRFRRGRDRLDETIYRIIEAGRSKASGQGDVLSALLSAEDHEGGEGRMTDKQIRDEALTLFLAGHETMAVALTWTWFLLAHHPEVEAQLKAELDDVLGGRTPTAEDLPKLEYTRMVLAESMRLYPPVYMIGRQALVDFPVDRYVIPAGSSIIMSQYITHRDSRYYPNPERFDPQRWTPEAQAARPKYSYFPFGGGVRVCIGEPFAWLEMILVVAALAQRWRFLPISGREVEMEPRVTLRPKGGMPLVVQRQAHVQGSGI